MRILQIIDSLEIGGAERMAINYANALSKKIDFSALVSTRKEGNLKSEIDSKVNYLFLEKKSAIDLIAVFKLKAYCKKNKIEFLQPHSTSYFTAFLVKLVYPKIQIIWHDHNGLSEFTGTKNNFILKIASCFFKAIIVVNYQLKDWASKELYCKQIFYLPNFTNYENNGKLETQLLGKDLKRILCLANLRHQKNHFFLLKVAQKLKVSHPDWSFHLVGKDFEDEYSKQIFELIKINGLEKNVFVYGSRNDSFNIISQSDIAILTSKSEGLPVALLEYGFHKMPVVITSVGQIPLIINDNINGFIVSPDDDELFYNKLITLIENPALRISFGEELQKTIIENHSESSVIVKYLDCIKKL